MKLTPYKKRKIKSHAMGSLYRWNAQTADCYAFSLTTDGEWQGGWDWTNGLVDKDAEYILILKTGKFIKNNLTL